MYHFHQFQWIWRDSTIFLEILRKMKNFNQIKKFEKKSGLIEVESGMLLKDLLPIIIEKGWFLPITPGTKYVSLGGIIANNVHGKNIYRNQKKVKFKNIRRLLGSFPYL